MYEMERLYEQGQRIKDMYPEGTRIYLNNMEDPYSPVPSGTRGTVKSVDSIGQIHMSWDNGRSLALVPGVDSFRKLTAKELEEEKFFRDNIIKEGIMHITVGDSQFETLEGPLNSSFAPDLARRCSVDAKDCGEFFLNCNLVTGAVKVCATYYPPSNEPGAVINVPLEESEKKHLLQALERYCQRHYKKDAIQVLNDQRSFIGLSFVKPRKPALRNQIADAEQCFYSHSKNVGKKVEQPNKKGRC